MRFYVRISFVSLILSDYNSVFFELSFSINELINNIVYFDAQCGDKRSISDGALLAVFAFVFVVEVAFFHPS